MDETASVDVYWRPGCLYCRALRRGLRGAGLPLREINIWSDPQAAAFVRSVAGGNETVPTVVVGGHAMVNPSTRQVLTAVSRAPRLPPTRSQRSRLRVGYAFVAVTAWLALAAARPDTTFHLAPAVVTAAWAVAERLAALGPLCRAHATATVAGGAGIAVIATAVLLLSGRMAGPALTGGSALAETLLVVAGAAAVTWWGVTRGSGRTPR